MLLVPRKVHHGEGHRPGHSHPEVGSLHPVVPSGAADDDAGLALRAEKQ